MPWISPWWTMAVSTTSLRMPLPLLWAGVVYRVGDPGGDGAPLVELDQARLVGELGECGFGLEPLHAVLVLADVAPLIELRDPLEAGREPPALPAVGGGGREHVRRGRHGPRR